MGAETRIDKDAKVVTVHEAKTHLSRLLAEVEAGSEIVLARGKVPVARLIPLTPVEPKRRTAGRYAEPGMTGILEDGFWDPLPDEHLGLSIRDRWTA